MIAFALAPIQVLTSKDSRSRRRYKVARVEGRYVGSAFAFGRNGYPEHQQWARAFLGACLVAPLVLGVRS